MNTGRIHDVDTIIKDPCCLSKLNNNHDNLLMHTNNLSFKVVMLSIPL